VVFPLLLWMGRLLQALRLPILELLMKAQASFDQLGGTGVQWFSNQVTVVPKSQQDFLIEDNLQKAFRVLLQSGASPALRLTKLDSAFLALLGGELRHGTLLSIRARKSKSSAFH
jgi:hypothetical protein